MRMAAIALGFWIGIGLASAGCGAGTQLVPARGPTGRRPPSAAQANVGGVRLLVEGDAWPGRSATLARDVSAVLVIVENHSDRPVEIRRDDFALQGRAASGSRPWRRTRCRPPVPKSRSRCRRPCSAKLRPTAATWFFRSGSEPGGVAEPRGASFPQNPLDFRPATITPQSFRRDLESRALAEGTLIPGQKRAGFVYFVGGLGGEDHVTLEARLQKPRSGSRPFDVAMADIPLRVK